MRRRVLRYLRRLYSSTGQAGLSSSLLRRRLSDRQKVVGVTLLSIGGNELQSLHIVALLTHYGLLFYITYLLARSVLGNVLPEIASLRGVRLILAGASTGVAAGTTRSSFIIHPPSFLLTIVVTCVLLDSYLSRIHEAGQHYPEDYLVRFTSVFLREPLADHREKRRRWDVVLDEADSAWVTRISNYVDRAATVVGLSFPFYLVGMFLPVFGFFYPVLEVGILVGAIFGPTIARKFGVFERGRDVLESADPEGDFTKAFSSEGMFQYKGFCSIGFVGLNLALPAVIFLIWIGMIAEVFKMFSVMMADQPISIVVLLGMMGMAVLSTPLLYGLSALWFWRTAFRRLPAFLECWETQSLRSTSGDSNESVDARTPRPPGGMVPPTVLLLTLPVLFYVQTATDTRTGAIAGIFGYIALWVGGITGLLLSVRRWRTIHPQSVSGESQALITNSLVQSVGLALFIGAITTFSGTSVNWWGVSVFLVLPIVALTLFYAEDARLWLRDERGLSAFHVTILAVFVGGIVFGVGWYYSIDTAGQVVLLVLWSVLVVAAGLQYLGQHLSQKYALAEPESEDFEDAG